MEFIAILFGLASLFAFFAALIGVPLLFRRVRVLQERVMLLELKAGAAESRSEVQTREANVGAKSVTEAPSNGQETPPFSEANSKQAEETPTAEPTPALAEQTIAEPTLEKTTSNASSLSPLPTNDALSEPSPKRTNRSKKPNTESVFKPLLDKLLALNITAQVGAIVLFFWRGIFG